MKDDLLKKTGEYAQHMAQLCRLPVCVVDPSERRISYCTQEKYDFFCSSCRCERCNKLTPFLYGSNEAYRWNGKYIYYCPAGLAFIASAILESDFSMIGALVAGPFIMGEPSDVLEDISDPVQTAQIQKLPVLSAAVSSDYSSLLDAVSTQISGILNTQRHGALLEQTQLLNSVYDAHEMQVQNAELVKQIQLENQLCDNILNQDRTGSQDTLNQLLGYIYFSCDFDLDRIRVRILELLVMLSRIAIKVGANIQQMLTANDSFLCRLNTMKSVEELSVWLTGVLRYYIDYTFDYHSTKHSDIIYKCIEFIKQNYSRKITLDDLSVHVSLSRSYLSKLFKDEIGCSLFSYINHVRIERSKQLLLNDSLALVDIAGLCGFEDQSYFTKVFKKETGVSPKRFRDNPMLRGDGTAKKNNG